MKKILLFVFLFSLLVLAKIRAALPYPLKGLLERSETVFVGKVTDVFDGSLNFQTVEVLRGDKSKFAGDCRLSAAWDKRSIRVGNTYLLISQGDNYRGEPKGIVSYGQPLICQASYRGWIMFPLIKKETGEMIVTGVEKGLTWEDIRKLATDNSYNPVLLYGGKRAQGE